MCYVLHPNAKKILRDHKHYWKIYHLNPPLIGLEIMHIISLNLDLRMPIFSCTGSAALGICIALSYKNIYVLGMDQNQLSSKAHYNKHFYDPKDEVPTGPIIRNYKNFYERLISKSNTIKCLLNLSNIAEKKGIKIYNISYKKSMIDFWRNKNYESFCNMK